MSRIGTFIGEGSRLDYALHRSQIVGDWALLAKRSIFFWY